MNNLERHNYKVVGERDLHLFFLGVCYRNMKKSDEYIAFELKKINNRFQIPLKENEIRSICNGISRTKYKLSPACIKNSLHIPEVVFLSYGLYLSKT